jgi:DNA-binding NtrC family response regulator
VSIEAEQDRFMNHRIPVAGGLRENTMDVTTGPPPGEILFVDDEEPIARLGHDLLDLLGFHAAALTSPRKALDMLRAEPDRFALLVVDLKMAEMNGLDLAVAMRKTKPDLPVILMSGLWDSNIIQELRSSRRIWSLSKPFTSKDLESTVRKAMYS